MKKTLLLLVTLTLISACTGTIDDELIFEQPSILDFEVVAQGFNAATNNNNPHQVIIQDQDVFNALWQEIHQGTTPTPQTPSINFEEQTIIAVFQGQQGTGGYNIEVTNVLEFDNRLEVVILETRPSPEDMVTQAFTHPYHIIQIPKTHKDIAFGVQIS